MQEIILNQQDLFRQAFAKIFSEVTTSDRLEAIRTQDVGRNTVINNLKGRITDLDTAEKLLTFFTARIEQRKKKVLQVINN